MNCEQIDLSPLEVERYQVKEALRILLHSIIFQRSLAENRYRALWPALAPLPACADARMR